MKIAAFFNISLLTLVFIFHSQTTHAQISKNADSRATYNEGITKKINDAFIKLEAVQGLSLAIYSQKNGGYVSSFGVTDIQTREKVNGDTAFYIASSTKSMFALLFAIAHEQGKIDLDQSIQDFAPDAPFPDSINAQKITLRHLLNMSSGIKNPSYVHRVAYSGEHDQTLLWKLIRETQPNQNKNIRLGHFRYTNWNYNLLARLLEHNTNKPWQQTLQEELFDKAGMSRTTAYTSIINKEGWSVARPHVTLGDDAPRKTYLEKTDKTMHSAGGVYMTANDALRWLSIFVNDGVVDNRRVFSDKAVQATRQKQTPTNTSFGKYQRDYYGLGWYIGPYIRNDVELVHHFGGFSGARAHVSYMPDEKIGVALFVNDSQVGSKFIDIVANFIYDSYLNYDLASESFEQEIQDLIEWKQEINAQLVDLRHDISKRKWTLDKQLQKYAGKYFNELYGTIEVKVESDTLRVTNGYLTALAQAGTETDSVRVELLPMEGQEIQFNTSWFSSDIKSLEFDGIEYMRSD